MRSLFLLATAALVLAACDATAPATQSVSGSSIQAADASAGDVEGRTLAAIRRGTARYHRVEQALADGYVPASPCVFRTDEDGVEVAAMGYHYVNFGLIEGAMPGDDRPTVLDPSAPEILLYEPQRNGRLRLVGVEFMASAAGSDWVAPMLDSVEFEAHLTEEVQHGIPFPHYDLHVWTWRNNPDGMFAGHNPNVSCEYAPAPGT